MMKKTTGVLILLILLILTSCSKSRHYDINPEKNINHIHVGEGVHIVKPYGFKEATSYNGFQDLRRGTSISMKVQYSDLESVAFAFDEKVLGYQNTKLLEFSTVKYGDNENAFYSVVFDKNKRTVRYLLAINEGEKTYLIKAFCLKGNEDKLGNQLKSALFSTYIGEEIAKTKAFIIADQTDQKTVYTRDGKLPTESVDQAIIKFSTFNHKGNLTITAKQNEYMVNAAKEICENSNPGIRVKNMNGVRVSSTKTNCINNNGYLTLLCNESSQAIFVKATTNDYKSLEELEKFVLNEVLEINLNKNF